MKRSVNMKIVGLSLFLVAIIFASTTFGTFEGFTEGTESSMMNTDGMMPPTGMPPTGMPMPTTDEEEKATTTMQGFRSR